MKIIVLGPPGAGKGTYTKMLVKEYNLPQISTGDLFRYHMANDTELGKQVKSYMDAGNLVPDEITTNMLKERIEQDDCANGYFLDGFPRTIPQAEMLDDFAEIDKVLNFVADDEVIIDRLSGRRVCKEDGSIFHIRNVPPKEEGKCDKCGGELIQRKDDFPDVIKERLEEYRKKTEPLITFYQGKGNLVDIDVNPPYEERERVLADIRAVLDDLQ